MTDDRVVLGRVLGAHGIRGQIRVRWLGDGPEHLLSADRVLLADGALGARDPAPQSHEIETGGTGRPGEVRLKLEGVDDRDAAEALRGKLVLGSAEALSPLREDEFYWYQLVGCRVELEGGEPVGTVRELWETGGHDVLVVRGEDGRDRLIPTARELMRTVDLEKRRITVVDLPGLVDPT